MFKKIFRGVRNALKSPAGMLGLAGLATLPFGGPGVLLPKLFSSGALKGGILPGILGLLTANALRGEGREEAVSFDDFESQTSKKYGSKFGGSPFLKDNFRDLQYNPADQAFYDQIVAPNHTKYALQTLVIAGGPVFTGLISLSTPARPVRSAILRPLKKKDG